MKPPVDRRDVDRFRDLVQSRTGMDFPESRASDVMHAVQRALTDSDAPDAKALYDGLLGRPDPSDAMDDLLSALNVGETHFFRDARQMQALEQRILPELIARRRSQRRIRLWSAGCSTGEEAYTLAILVARLLPDLADWDVLILATDINERSLDWARRGVYRAWSLRGVSPLGLAPYLTGRGERFEVAAGIRAMVTFAHLNLAADVYPSRSTKTEAMDLVLCRNVLMYFDCAGAQGAVGRLRRTLGDGGKLVVSQVEAGLPLFDGMAQDRPGTAVFVNERPKPGGVAVPLPRVQPPPRVEAVRADDVEADEEALSLWRAGHAEAALRALEVAIKGSPLTASLHYLHGMILLDAARTDEALAAFRRCTYADPESVLGHLAQASLFAGRGLPSRARAELDTTTRLVADLEPDAVFFRWDDLTVGDVLELIAGQRDLLSSHETADPSRG